MDNFICIEEQAAPGHLSSRRHYVPTQSISHITEDIRSDVTWVCLKTGKQIPVDIAPVTIIVLGLRGTVISPQGNMIRQPQ